jgi:hypothetical protein
VALEGSFGLEDADRVVGREAPNVVALSKLKIHGGDDAGAREVAEIAKLLLTASAPIVQRHGAWYLALHAMCQGNADEAHNWLNACDDADRQGLFPLFPLEIEDDPQRRQPRTRGGYGKARRSTCRPLPRCSQPGRACWQRRRHSKTSDAGRPPQAPPLRRFRNVGSSAGKP